MSTVKPRARFCWACGNKLYQSKVHVERVIDGHPRILHKQCAREIERGTFEEDDSEE